MQDTTLVSKKLIRKYGHFKAIEYLDTLFDFGNKFPYNSLSSLSIDELYKNLLKFKPPFEVLPSSFKLNSYLPKYNSYLPAKFRGKFVTIKHEAKSYEEVDVITDLFVEPLRIQARKLDQKMSLEEIWKTSKDFRFDVFDRLLKRSPTINNKTVRDAIYTFPVETGLFNVSWAKSLLILAFKTTKLDNLSWLDISAGWGDRLITSCAMKMNYVGCDPNTELKPYHDQMLEKFSTDGRHRRIIYEPFETADIESPEGGYDIILSSPPFFNVEVYSDDKNQSYNKFPNYSEWMVGFLFTSLKKAWSLLKNNGFLVLHIGDSKANNITMCEATMFFIEKYLENSSYEGTIGVQGGSGFYRPVWIWKKTDTEHKFWVPETYEQLDYKNRTLKEKYVYLWKLWNKDHPEKNVKTFQDQKALQMFALNSEGLKLSDLISKETQGTSSSSSTSDKKASRSKFEESLLKKFSKVKIQSKGMNEDLFSYVDFDDIDKYTKEFLIKLRETPKGKALDVSSISSTGTGIRYIVSPNIKQRAIGILKIQSPVLPIATTNLKSFLLAMNFIPNSHIVFKEDIDFMKNKYGSTEIKQIEKKFEIAMCESSSDSELEEEEESDSDKLAKDKVKLDKEEVYESDDEICESDDDY